jgi:hypothetical protein
MAHGLRFANKASRIFCVHRRRENIITKSSDCRVSRVPQTGTCGPSVGQTVKESAMAESPRVALQRQAAIAGLGQAHQVLVNGLRSPTIIKRAPLRLALAKRCSTDRNLRYKSGGGFLQTRLLGMVEIRQVWERRSKPSRTKVRCSQILPPRRCLPNKSPRPASGGP